MEVVRTLMPFKSVPICRETMSASLHFQIYFRMRSKLSHLLSTDGEMKPREAAVLLVFPNRQRRGQQAKPRPGFNICSHLHMYHRGHRHFIRNHILYGATKVNKMYYNLIPTKRTSDGTTVKQSIRNRNALLLLVAVLVIK